MGGIDVRHRSALERSPAHEVALECLLAGIEAAQPAACVERRVTCCDGSLVADGIDGIDSADGESRYDLESFDDVVIVGGGNAAGGFAAALEAELGDRLDAGVVVTDDPAPTDVVDVLPGEHPTPSRDGVHSTRRVLEVADTAGANDLVVAVVTGGASSLLAAPAGSLSLADLQAVTDALLAVGAPIAELNAVRKHCSAIKGGYLAREAAPATVCTIALSDVVGDRPSVIGSGPTVPDETTYDDALEVLERYDLGDRIPDTVRDHLESGAGGEHPETPTAGDPAFDRTRTHVVGRNHTALEAAQSVALERGYEPLILSSRVRGEAREAALTQVAIAEECRATGTPVEPPAVILSGGETTVSVSGRDGTGGPNQEFVTSGALGFADGTRSVDGVVVAGVDTDGVDGPTDAAGAIADADTISESAGRTALDDHDVYSLLEDADALVRTGPTGTNVSDLRVIVLESVDDA
ncbi:glycerate kinase type-2 family protein [Natrarchaeobaculum aegyptiacum]|uniref:Glycerate kinase n=1 Tax=Natrarchaeobaculum aegyptiacum TaxID=745377 RepID=A0A2Z2HYC5_9EURY|nr:DUF4147 domain-containing protein [Natrarchaeobaculum aegyptiacum]ARS90757.1 glycerate kinase [Natrarchaeobaculum aegyptiacum]